MQKKLTIQDIARLAGVSKATVSRVLNSNPSVNSTLSQRVMNVVQEHSFVPNVNATVLAGGRTPLIGVLAPPLNWPAIPEIMRGVAKYIEDTPYEIVLYSTGFERNHSDVLNSILAMRMVSGLLAILPGKLARDISTRFQQGLPLVMIDDQEEPMNVPWVGIDNLASAYKATRYLLELGHKRIAHILGPQTYYCAVERYQGYRQAMQDAGLSPDPTLLLQGNFETASGRLCASMLFARDKSTWPSAIFVGNDEMAYGVLEVAEERGIRIPEDIAIVGFDDYMLSAHMRPPLTTIRQPFFEMGYKAIETLLTMIDPHPRLTRGGAQQTLERFSERLNTEQMIRIQLPTRLVVRTSSSALPTRLVVPTSSSALPTLSPTA
jgi:LacI family transcriptional regulator